MEAFAAVVVIVAGGLIAWRWWLHDRAAERRERATAAQGNAAEQRQVLDKSLRDIAEVSERVKRLEARGVGAAITRPATL